MRGIKKRIKRIILNTLFVAYKLILRNHNFKLIIRYSSIKKRNSKCITRSTISINLPDISKPNKIIDNKAFSRDTQQYSIISNDWYKELGTFLLNQLSDHTRRAYENDIKQFLNFLRSKYSLHNIFNLRTEHIVIYRKFLEEGRLSGKPLAKATINRKLAVVKSFFNWLKVNKFISDNPAEFVKGYPQSQESSLKGFSDEEVCKILSLPNRNSKTGALHLAILHVLLYLGLRKGELIHLKIGDLTTERGVNVIKVRGKGHRIRVLPITDRVKATIDNYFYVCKRDISNKEAPLFCPTKNPKGNIFLKTLNPNSITYIVSKYSRKAGILKNISPHSCRATCISHALDKHATHRSVQYLAGWTTPLMIQRYDKRREELSNSAAFLIDYGEVNSYA